MATQSAGIHAPAAGRRPALLTTLAALPVLLAGCQVLAPAPLTPAERLDVETRAVDLLARATEHPDAVVACNAIEALARAAPARDGLPAFRRAVHAEIPMVRFAAFAALGDRRDHESLPLIMAGMRDAEAHVRLAAAYAACRCGRQGYARLLLRTLTDAPDENLRADAANLIGRLEEPRAESWLRDALRLPANQHAKRVLLEIQGALARLGQPDAIEELIRYSQGDAATRTAALLLLADLGRPEARDALRYRFGPTEEYDEARLIAARGLGRLGCPDGFELAMKMINYTDPNPHPGADNPNRTFPMRSLAIHALAEIGDERALPALRAAARSDDPRIQVAACYALLRLLNR